MLQKWKCFKFFLQNICNACNEILIVYDKAWMNHPLITVYPCGRDG